MKVTSIYKYVELHASLHSSFSIFEFQFGFGSFANTYNMQIISNQSYIISCSRRLSVEFSWMVVVLLATCTVTPFRLLVGVTIFDANPHAKYVLDRSIQAKKIGDYEDEVLGGCRLEFDFIL